MKNTRSLFCETPYSVAFSMKEAAETYRANHPGCNMVNDDINNVFDELSNYAGVDLVFGGPPCQGFSVAGKMDPDDERSKLIFTFLDVIEKVRPRIFVMENVKALGILDKWEPVRKKYMDRAFSLGYNCASFMSSFAKTTLKPAVSNPISIPPAPVNNEIAVSLLSI